MYIKSVIIDGFKSYGKRTEINDFDPEFTAITGLNGTGKSNILDSICFVLGIMNLGQVRASSLQDLVYKNGQAGITKATVTLIFDNSNRNQCPLGYEKCREISVTRQIIVGGKNKYLINGKLVQNKKVTDFFCSVQLNINNPSFLIMQGRITKVLNMKPQEILAMIEEAAGTSMYETKRVATTKLIEKKDAKVREANSVLDEEVQPKLTKLRLERDNYNEFQNISRDVEYLTRISISYKYLKLEKSVTFNTENIEKINQCITELRELIENNTNECVLIDESCKELQNKINNESDGEHKQLEIVLNKQIDIVETESSSIKFMQENINEEEKKIRTLINSIAKEERVLKDKEKLMSNAGNLFKQLKEADANDEAAYKEAQRRFEAISQGLSTDDAGQPKSLQDQLISAQHHLSEAKTTIKTSEMELKHNHTVLRQKENETQNSDAAYNKDKQLHDQLVNEIARIQKEMDNIDYQEGAFEMLQEQKNNLTQEIRKLKQQMDRANAYRYELQYRDPEPNFNRSKVRGMVGKLFTVNDKSNCLALMMAGGGSIYSYVTDDDVTSKQILQKGQLQRRVTIIPINKISSHPIEASKVKIAENLVGQENVQPALALLKYDKYFDPVLKFVFGHTFICHDLNVAKQVTYNRKIYCRSVTLEGDVVDPEGTLSGGSRPKGANILEELAAISEMESKIREFEAELIEVNRKISIVESRARSYNELKKTMSLRQVELDGCKLRLSQTTFEQHQEEIKSLKTLIEKLQRNLSASREIERSSQDKIIEIQNKLSDSKGYRERELKVASDEMKAAKLKSEKSLKEWKEREQEFETLELEISELVGVIANLRTKSENITENLEKMRTDLDNKRSECDEAKRQIAVLQQQIKEQKDILNSQNKELKNLLIKKQTLEKKNEKIVLDIKKNEADITKFQNNENTAAKALKHLETQYTWIIEDRQYFGMKNTRYDYSKENPKKVTQKLEEMLEKKSKMERTINVRALMLLDREEEIFHETLRRRKICEEDREKIHSIITKMDETKRDKMDKAWKAVNVNFSNIFSSLLEGAQAKLSPVSTKKNELLGLEIKVGFNNIWKESLGELSGGQRSLVALSLVLAMLKFSPAPLYILDEVDAALDMSHTQNIGNMLKAHFKNSQFIIVSLKDGMFNNANVLYRTRFEEGVSAVVRIVNPKLMRPIK